MIPNSRPATTTRRRPLPTPHHSPGVGAPLAARLVTGLNVYFQEAAALHPAILRNVLSQYFADPALGQTRLLITEFGR